MFRVIFQSDEPIWREGKYTPFGKWMDGWETRRRRKPGHDFCILELAAQTIIHAAILNTAFFTGNHAPTISIQASDVMDRDVEGYIRCAEMGSEAPDEEVETFSNVTKDWSTILTAAKLKPGYPETCINKFTIVDRKPYKFLRLNLYPDGGVARLRVLGHVVPPTKLDEVTNLISIANGGECVKFSNAHFGHPKNLLSPKKSSSMADGWETARRLDRSPILKELPNGLLNYNGSEWCILKLGIPGKITKIIVDTRHFLGNYPDQVLLEGKYDNCGDNAKWTILKPYAKLSPNAEHKFDITCDAIFKYVKVTIQPDGGLSRVRVLGHPVIQ